MSRNIEFAGGCFAGAINVLVGFPFDTVHLQTAGAVQASHATPGGGSMDVAQSIYRRTGVLGFFKGVSTPLLGGAAECGVNYFVYSQVLKRLHEHTAQPTIAQTAAAAGVAGVALSVILAPVELIKCRLQLQATHYRTPLQCLRVTLREEGLVGLGRGFGATLAREVPGNAIFFASYEAIKRRLQSTLSTDLPAQDKGTFGASSLGALHDAASCVVAGGLSGSLMWAVVLPIDTAKTRIQTARPGSAGDIGLVRQLVDVSRQGGFRSLWAGITPAIIRAFPANAAQWIAYECALRALASDT